MAEIRFTLIPQFTIRWILALTAVMAVVSLVIAQAVRGQAWAAGIVMAFVVVVFAFAVYAAVFAAVLGVSALAGRRKGRKAEGQTQLPSEPPVAKPPRLGATGVVIAALAATLALCANVSLAATGGGMTLPTTGPNAPPNRSGLQLTLDDTWIDGFGYRPVRVDAKSLTGPLAADRVLEITFRPTQMYTTTASVAVTQTLEIPAGASSASMTLSVPQLSQWGMFTLDTYEDGVLIKELSISRESAFPSWSGSNKGDAASPAVLLLSGSNPTILNTMMSGGLQGEMLAASEKTGGVIAATLGNPAVPPGLGSFTSIGAPIWNDLPTAWIDYSGFDLIVASFSDLQQFAKTNPQQWQAVQKWQQSGGTLVVYGAGNGWENLAQLETLTGIATGSAKASAAKNPADPDSATNQSTVDTNALLRRGWRLPLKSIKNNALNTTDAATVYNPDGSVELLQFNESSDNGEAKPAADATEKNSIDLGTADDDSIDAQDTPKKTGKKSDKEVETQRERKQLLADLTPAAQAPFI
ncbi:MAG TPA: hypothetical protein VGJ15_03850, partial [Pirellulales bacterium]